VSLRAEVIRLGMRWFIKRRAHRQTVEQARAQLAAVDRFIPNPPAGTETAVVDAGGVSAHCIMASVARRDRHILFLHGGGYVTGSPSLYRHLTWRIGAATRAAVLAIDYRLAPEHPFPAALDDAVTSYRWLLAGGADPRRIAVMGDSAGGGLAFALLLKLRDERTPLPAAAVALSPWTDLALTGPSVTENAAADPMLSVDGARELAGFYLAGADPRTPYASPLYGDQAGLPPALIQVGSDEVARDDTVRMAQRLRAAGCRVEIEIWPRMPHVWHLFAPLLPEANRAIVRIGIFLDRNM
jgi:monoterpene epsilon-lactone hydrolase